MGISLEHFKGNFRIFLMIIQKNLVKQRIWIGWRTTNPQSATIAGDTCLDFFFCRIFQVADGFDFIVQNFTGICKFEMAWISNDKLGAIGFFQAFDLIT